MNEEKKYLKPEMEVIEFVNDIVTVSNNADWNGDDNMEDFANWARP